MKTHFKFIEWRDAPGLNQDIKQSLSDLEFLKDELHFLTDLVAEPTLEVIYNKPHEESAKISEELLQMSKRLEALIEKLYIHKNNLQILTDDVEVPNELKTYKKEHYGLMIAAMDFHSDMKRTKRQIFTMISELMRKGKLVTKTKEEEL